MTAYFVRSIWLSALVLGLPSFSVLAQAQVDPPEVPTDIQVPAGFSPFLKGYAIGTQNYMCVAEKKEKDFVWKFMGPQATLFVTLPNGQMQQVTTHFLSANPVNGLLQPTWQHSDDTSSVWGLRKPSTNPVFVDPGAIPWLLLEVTAAQAGPSGGDFMTEAVFIHRVNTTGGLAPSTGCSEAAQIGTVRFVPYTADYFFYRADQ
jgi:hypothetical protein